MINTLRVLSNTLPAHTLKIQEVRDASKDAKYTIYILYIHIHIHTVEDGLWGGVKASIGSTTPGIILIYYS